MSDEDRAWKRLMEQLGELLSDAGLYTAMVRLLYNTQEPRGRVVNAGDHWEVWLDVETGEEFVPLRGHLPSSAALDDKWRQKAREKGIPDPVGESHE